MTNKLRTAGVGACILVALLGCRPGASPGAPAHECWTREHVAEPLTPGAARYLAPGTFRGRVALPDPSNPFVGLHFTGEHCHTRIRHANGRILAETSLLSAPVALAGRMHDGPYYVGHVADGTVLVVQTDGKAVVATTHTVFDAQGVLVYGVCGSPGFTMIRECITDG